MKRSITYLFKLYLSILSLFTVMFFASFTEAWTNAVLSKVDVTLDISKEVESEVTTIASFSVSGGSFHGFDMAPQKDSRLVKEKCRAYTDDNENYPLIFRKLFDGRTRILLSNKKYINKGTINFVIVHSTSLTSSGAVAVINKRARLNWIPAVWDYGTNSMSVTVNFPQSGQKPGISIDEDVAEDYEVSRLSDNSIKFLKYSAVKWYPMQVVLDFNKSLVPLAQKKNDLSKRALSPKSPAGSQIATSGRNTYSITQKRPMWHNILFLVVPLIGFILMILRFLHIKKVYKNSIGINANFKFLRNTKFDHRIMLSVLAILLGAAAQIAGSVAASVLPMVTAVMIWIVNRVDTPLKSQSGGTWRKLSESEIDEYREIYLSYRRGRSSFLDISTLPGFFTFIAILTLIIFTAYIAGLKSSHSAWAVAISSIIWIFPIWFSITKGELPVDPSIESFVLLYKWRKGLAKLIGKSADSADASFWVREDNNKPLEVRMRIENVPSSLTGLEVGAEVVRTSAIYQVKKVTILKMKPGTPTAKQFAACDNASEHHLTPNLTQEIIVFRNRRGFKESGLASLKRALSILKAESN